MRVLRARLLLPLLGLLPLAGCDRDAAELVRDINAARAGCTEAGLRAESEECVRMMERYAEMGTEAIQTYIGAVRALDQALRRMPTPAFDTSGLGHPLSRPPGGWTDAAGPAPGRFRGGYAPREEWTPDHRGPAGEGWGYGPREGWDSGRGAGADPYYGDPDYEEPYYGEPYYGEPYSGDPYDGGPYYGDPSAGDRYDRDLFPGGPYGSDPSYPRHPRYDDPRYEDPYGSGYGADPRADPSRRGAPQRGRLLPPGERLRRPWLEERGARPRAYRGAGPREWPDTAARREAGPPRLRR